MKKSLRIQNSGRAGIASVPVVDNQQFKERLVELVTQKCRLSALFLLPGTQQNNIYAVVSNDEDASLELLATPYQREFASLTPELPQAHWFERELHEIHGVNIIGHPWLKPIRFQPKAGDNAEVLPGVTTYFEVTGEEVHEVAVGPVHAGIIEPGHFRFQCHGEKVFHLEIELGYQHRGIEKALLRNPSHQNLRLVEVVAGDTSVAHATAYAMLIESLHGMNKLDKNAHLIRAVALELERMANHTGDLGALAGDVGFLPTSAYCGRIRGDILNTTAVICGNRFGRGLIRPGGIGCPVDRLIADTVLERLVTIEADLKSAVKLLWDTPSVVARFEETGTVTRDDAIDAGLVGPAARACGLRTDIRCSHPWGAYIAHQPELVDGRKRGDVYGRAIVRWLELQDSMKLIRAMLAEFSDVSAALPVLTEAAPDSIAVALTEGWRGEVCHVVITGSAGKLASYKIVDPSFHNWFGLMLALRNQEISDFPLCNKSFNLSYCGHDL